MKRDILVLACGWITFLITVLMGCSDDNNNGGLPDTPENINIWPLIEAGTRVSGNDFETDDTIGIYAVPYQDSDTPGDLLNSGFAENLPYVFTGYSWQQPSGALLRWPDSGFRVDFYGYYPYDESLNSANPTDYPFRIQMDQGDKAGYAQSDLLWATRRGIEPTTDPVELGFEHILSKVRVNVKSEIAINEAEWEDAVIYIVNTETEGRIDLQNGAVTTGSGNTGVITAARLQVPQEGYEISGECIIFPQSITRGLTFIRIEFPSTGVRYSYQPVESVLFEQGKERPFNITITNTGLLVSVGNIADWQASDEIEGDIGKPLPKVLDLSGIDWQVNKVYGIYEDDYKVGEVVREYLYAPAARGAVSAQAVVVYIVNVDGEMDYNIGYVAQIMGTTRNTLLDIYEPATGNIHGGVVTWNFTDSNIDSYTQGTSALTSKVSLSYNGVDLETDNAIPTLTVIPETVSDYENNIYPVVKVGVQFWTGVNWKSEYNRDGTPVTVYYFDDDEVVNKNLYGGLYSWNTANGINFAPEGWTIPLLTDWAAMRRYTNVQAQKLKANVLWSNLNNSDNMAGFTALPAGRRTDTGVYNELYQYGQWWTSTLSGASDAQRVWMDAGHTDIVSATMNRATWTQSVRFLRE